MRIPFVGGSYTGRSTNNNAQRCVNLFPVIDRNDAKEVLSMYGTPGLNLFCAVEAEAADTVMRAQHVMGGVMYVVLGPRVYSVTSAGVATLLGTITTSAGYVGMDDNGTQVIIVDGTANGYLIEAGVLTAISDADFPAASSVTFQDGYFIVTETGTGKIFISTTFGFSFQHLPFVIL